MNLDSFLNKKYILIGILTLHILLLTQIKFTAWPEMLLWPYLMLKGWLPYKDIAIAHNPLLLLDLSIFYKLFGVGAEQLKMYTWILILAIDSITFFIARKIWNERTALLSVIFLIPLTIYFDANGLWFDLALALIFPFIFYFTKVKKHVLVGVFWALAFLTKQTAVWLIIPIAIYTFKGQSFKVAIKLLEKLVLGILLITLPFLVIVWNLNILQDYLFWAYKFAGGALPFSDGQISFPTIKQLIFGFFPYLSFVILFVFKTRRKYFDVLVFGVFAALGVYPRWEMFHLLPAIPFIAFMMAGLAADLKQSSSSYNKSLTIFFITILTLLSLRVLFSNLNKETRFLENNVLETARIVKSYTKESDKIFVLNDWEHYYALTDTLPAAKPWVPQFSWYFSVPGVEDKMLNNIIFNSPSVIVMHSYSNTGLDSFRPQKIANYIDKYYFPIQISGSSIIMKKR